MWHSGSRGSAAALGIVARDAALAGSHRSVTGFSCQRALHGAGSRALWARRMLSSPTLVNHVASVSIRPTPVAMMNSDSIGSKRWRSSSFCVEERREGIPAKTLGFSATAFAHVLELHQELQQHSVRHLQQDNPSEQSDGSNANQCFEMSSVLKKRRKAMNRHKRRKRRKKQRMKNKERKR